MRREGDGVKNDRIEERPCYWRYKGHGKIHFTPYFAALIPDAHDEAEQANKDAGYSDGIAEYAAACEAGTVVIVNGPTS